MLGIPRLSDSQEKWGVEYPPASIAIRNNNESVEFEGIEDLPNFALVTPSVLGNQLPSEIEEK